MTDFGYDTSCLTSIRTGRFASGPRLVAEAMYRRFTTPRGMLVGGEDEANYGLDLLGVVGTIDTPSKEAALPGQIEAEALKDERIESVDVTVVSEKVGPAAVGWTITIEGHTAAGPFSLVLGIKDVNVSILGLTPGA